MSKRLLLIGAQLDSAWATTLRAALQPLGALTSISPSQALEPSGTIDHDLVILDAAADDETYSILTRIRQANPRVPILVMTASPTWQRARRVFLAGGSDYLRKSLDENALLKTIKQLLSRE